MNALCCTHPTANINIITAHFNPPILRHPESFAIHVLQTPKQQQEPVASPHALLGRGKQRQILSIRRWGWWCECEKAMVCCGYVVKIVHVRVGCTIWDPLRPWIF